MSLIPRSPNVSKNEIIDDADGDDIELGHGMSADAKIAFTKINLRLRQVERNYVTQEEFRPAKLFYEGLIKLIIVSVAGALIAGVLTR